MTLGDTVHALEQIGLQRTPARVLGSLIDEGAAAQGAVAARLQLSAAAVSTAVRRLAGAGLATVGDGRPSIVSPVALEVSLPAFLIRHQEQLHRAMDRRIAACRALGVDLDLPGRAGAGGGWMVQPLPLSTNHQPYLLPAQSLAGSDRSFQLRQAVATRDVVLSALGPAHAAPRVGQLLMPQARRIEVRVVISSARAASAAWVELVEAYRGEGIHVRLCAERAAPFTVVDRRRAALPIPIRGQPRTVWIDEPEQLANLTRLFAALWEDGRTRLAA